MNEEQLLKMKVGDVEWENIAGVLRVIGGWVYMFHDQRSDTITSSVYVPAPKAE